MYSPTTFIIFHILSLTSQGCAELSGGGGVCCESLCWEGAVIMLWDEASFSDLGVGVTTCPSLEQP